MRFRFIGEHQSSWPVTIMCRVLQVTRSGYYAWHSRPESQYSKRRKKLAKMIQIVHVESRETYGSPRVYRDLKALDYDCSENLAAKLMREGKIAAKSRRKFRCTTDSRHNLPVAPNLLARDFSPAAKNQSWVTDITYIPTREGWVYLCTVEDLFSRRIVGWSTSSRVNSRLVVDAMQMAIDRRGPQPGLIISDRGSQYCSDHFQRLLKKHRFRCSMSRKGDCWDNAPMESFYRTLKVELVYWEDYGSRDEAVASLAEFIEVFYNRRRRHSTLGYVSPVEFETVA
jgi:putative transposase